MMSPWMGPEWKPERSKMVLTLDPATRFMLVQVDPGAPGGLEARALPRPAPALGGGRRAGNGATSSSW
jgi:hypothetical protein